MRQQSRFVIDRMLQETSGAVDATLPVATSEVIVGAAIKAHQNIQSAAAVPPTLLLQAMQDAVRCMQLSDGSVPAPSLIALALLLCPGSSEEKQEYAMLLVPNGTEVSPARYTCCTLLALTSGYFFNRDTFSHHILHLTCESVFIDCTGPLMW